MGSAYLFAHLPSNVGKALLAVEALGLETAVPQHLDDLGVLLPVFTEDQLALVVVVLVFATSPIFSSLGTVQSISNPSRAINGGHAYLSFILQSA